MKKTIALLLSFMIIIALPLTVCADASQAQIEYYADGSYGVTTYESSRGLDLTRGTVGKTKNYTFYNSSDVMQWKVSLSGTFSYTGSSATCTSASTTYVIYNSVWKVTKSQASKSGRTATGEFTVKRYLAGVVVQTVNKTLTLTCSNSGVVS